MLTYNLEQRGKTSLYEYLYNCIKQDILAGKIRPGEKLPSKREMAKNHNISVITVENAYAQLLVEGYIFAKEKRGYFVGEIHSAPTQQETYRQFAKNEDLQNFSMQENGFRAKTNTPEKLLEHQEETFEKRWLVDFSSSHIMYDSFPFATWSKMMRQTLLDEERSFLKSPTPKGVPKLRMAIAEHLRHFRGMEVNPDNIIVGAGTEYLYSLIVQLLGHNRMIAVEDPGYQKISRVYESAGVKCLHIGIDRDGLSVRDLENSNAKAAHISPSHHFPTGRVMPILRRQQLLKWALENNSYIIEDDYDSEFRFSGKPIPTMAGIDNRRVIYMNTFSKTLVPSIRIAYMVLPDGLMEQYDKKLGFYSGTVSSFEQYTLANFISKGYYERHINRMRNYYRGYRNKILTAIRQHPIYDKVTIEEENAGLHFILGIKKPMDDAQFQQILRAQNINISSVTDYCYHHLEEFRHKFIINYSAVEEDKLLQAFNIMNEVLRGKYQ